MFSIQYKSNLLSWWAITSSFGGIKPGSFELSQYFNCIQLNNVRFTHQPLEIDLHFLKAEYRIAKISLLFHQEFSFIRFGEVVLCYIRHGILKAYNRIFLIGFSMLRPMISKYNYKTIAMCMICLAISFNATKP